MAQFQTTQEVQEYYDEKLRPVGLRAPQPGLNESINGYRRGFLGAGTQKLLQKDPTFSNVDFSDLKSDALDVLEPQVLEAFAAARLNPANYPPGEIKPIKVRDPYTGHVQETKWIGGLDPKYGEQHSFIKDLTRAGRRVTAFMRPMDSIQTFSARREIA